MKSMVIVATSAMCLGACASIPPVEYKYYGTKAETEIKLVRTVKCNLGSSELSFQDVTSATTTFSADRSKPAFSINIKDLEGGFGGLADSEFTMTFYEDGRLKGINQSTTGQGEAVVKAAVAAVSVVLPGVGLLAAGNNNSIQSQCLNFALRSGGSPTIVYSATVDPSTPTGTRVPLRVSRASQSLAQTMTALPPLFVEVSAFVPDRQGVFFEDKGRVGPIVKLPIQRTGFANVSVTQHGEVEPIWSTTVLAPETIDPNNLHYLPIPKAAFFGKQSFSIAIADSGAIASIGYGKTAGTASALGSAAALGTSTNSAAAARTAALKAKADEIAQENRLRKCREKPEECT